MVFFHYVKAFDKVCYSVLLQKFDEDDSDIGVNGSQSIYGRHKKSVTTLNIHYLSIF